LHSHKRTLAPDGGLRTGSGWTVAGGDPEPASKAVIGLAMLIYSTYVIGDEVTKYFYNKQKEDEWNQRILQAKSSKKVEKKKLRTFHLGLEVKTKRGRIWK